MATTELTDQFVSALAKVEKPTLIYDAHLKGFGLRVMPPTSRNARGAQSWIVEYRPGAGGRRTAKKRVTLGSTELLTEKQARAMATELLARSRADPESRGMEPLQTVAELSSIYREETDAIRKAGTVVLYRGYWQNHILPALGPRVVMRLERHDVVRLHRRIGATNKTTANRVLGLLSHFYTWAVAAGYLPIGCNPCRSVDKFKECGRERFLSQEELASLGTALRERPKRVVSFGLARLQASSPSTRPKGPSIAAPRSTLTQPTPSVCCSLPEGDCGKSFILSGHNMTGSEGFFCFRIPRKDARRLFWASTRLKPWSGVAARCSARQIGKGDRQAGVCLCLSGAATRWAKSGSEAALGHAGARSGTAGGAHP